MFILETFENAHKQTIENLNNHHPITVKWSLSYLLPGRGEIVAKRVNSGVGVQFLVPFVKTVGPP